MASAGKRKPDDRDAGGERSQKKQKMNKKWRQGRSRKGHGGQQGSQIEIGDAGIWATCDKGREPKCVNELRDLFQDFAEKLYADEVKAEGPVKTGTSGTRALHEDNNNEDKDNDDDDDDDEGENDAGGADDLEAQINSEVAAIRNPTTTPLFTNVRIDMQCVIFFKTRTPVEPVQLVHALCSDLSKTHERRTRFVKRLTPISCMARATEDGLDEVSRRVLAPHFHGTESGVKKFAIRPTLRNHNAPLTRNVVIQRVAGLVGAPHRVDLDEPDLVILVDVYKSHCGMSVVPGDYEVLKRYNLAEIYEPSAGGVADAQGSQVQKENQRGEGGPTVSAEEN